MSLDVYLQEPGQTHKYEARVFVREDGCTKELTRTEWDERFPGKEPFTTEWQEMDDVYSRNITHNLAKMAEAAGIYQQLWRPDEIEITNARELIKPLEEGLSRLLSDPESFKKLNPPNGWGSYDGLVSFVQDYLQACKDHPNATVYVSR